MAGRFRTLEPGRTSAAITQVVVDNHASEAAYSWQRHEWSAPSPRFRLRDLARVDNKVRAHLHGLVLAGEAGWEACAANIADGMGELFAAAMLALRSGTEERLVRVREECLAMPEHWPALTGAAERSAAAATEPWLCGLLEDDDDSVLLAGLNGYALRGAQPPCDLAELAHGRGPEVQRCIAKLIGDLRLAELAPVLFELLQSPDAGVRVWAARSFQFMQQKPALALTVLREGCFVGGEPAALAADMLGRMAKPDLIKNTYDELIAAEPNRRTALWLVASAGTVAMVDGALTLLDDPKLARLAGLVLTQVTGVDIEYQDLDGEDPARAAEPEADEDEEENDDDAEPEAGEGEPDEDEPPEELADQLPDTDAPWPHPQRVRNYWAKQRGTMAAEQRYVAGQAVGPSGMSEVLRSGTQPQRAAAATELMLGRDHRRLYLVSKPGTLQAQELLGWT